MGSEVYKLEGSAQVKELFAVIMTLDFIPGGYNLFCDSLYVDMLLIILLLKSINMFFFNLSISFLVPTGLLHILEKKSNTP